VKELSSLEFGVICSSASSDDIGKKSNCCAGDVAFGGNRSAIILTSKFIDYTHYSAFWSLSIDLIIDGSLFLTE
jgi:Domain of unknown function (DUF4200)